MNTLSHCNFVHNFFIRRRGHESHKNRATQGEGESPGSGASHEGGLPHEFWLRPRLGCRKWSQELPWFFGPPSPHLAAQNHQPGTTVLLRQLGVSPLLPPPRLVQGCSADCCALTSSSPVAPDWRHHDGVDGELRTSEQREAINDNLQSAVVDLMEEEEVHTLNSNVCCDPTPCLRAHPSGCVLQWKTSAPQHSCQRTRCAMMATRIKWSTTSAGERRQGQGLPKAAEEQNPELLWLKPQFHGDGHASERKSRHGTLLGTKESLFSGSKSGLDIPSQEFVLHCVRRLLLPPFLAWSHENTECEGSSGERMKKNWRKYWHGSWRKLKTKVRWSHLHRRPCCAVGEHKTKHACIVEDNESVRIRMEGSQNKDHENHLFENAWGQWVTTIWCTNLFLCLEPWKYQMQRQQWRKNEKKLKKVPAWQLTKVRNKSEVIAERWNKCHTVHVSSLIDLCHLKNSELEPQFQKYKRSSCIPRWHCDERFRIVCSIFWPRIISFTNDDCKKWWTWCQGYQSAQDKKTNAISAYTQIKMEDAPSFLKIPKSECPDIWTRLPKHTWPKSWSSMEDPVVF